MKRYTLGFVFDPDQEQVLLIHKTHPDWQKGRVNGVGGKIDDGEEPAACIAREVEEETGLDIPEKGWREVALLAGTGWEMFVFAAVYSGDKNDAISRTEEAVGWFGANDLPANALDNVNWIVPLCKDALSSKDSERKIVSAKVAYS